MVCQIGHFIGGKHVDDTSSLFVDIFNPSTGAMQARVARATSLGLRATVENAKVAQIGWGAANPQRRARVLMKFLKLVNKGHDFLVALLSGEHGKAVPDAKGNIQRGLEVIEFFFGIPHLQKGEYSESAGTGIDVFSMRQSLGVVAGITPFNFLAMIPLWKARWALAYSNAMILKLSERDPSVPMRIAELFLKAGLALGVLNVVNGDKVSHDAILSDPDIKAIDFLGSMPTAYHTFSGWKRSGFGDLNQHRPDSVRLFSKTKTAPWPFSDEGSLRFVIPTMA